MVRYLIADDHTIFRQGLRLVLGDDPELELLAEAGNGQQVLDLLEIHKPDVILLDLKMPVLDGIEATRELNRRFPAIRILILTMHDDEQLILHLLDAGAHGYIVKNADADEIKIALHACKENGYYFSDFVSCLMLKSLMHRRAATPKFEKAVQLTLREEKVLKLMCEGLTAVEIGRNIYLSHRTVEGIKSSLLEKIGVRNTAGLIMYAVKNGIVV